MADNKPLLLFPQSMKKAREKEKASFGSSTHYPNHDRQKERITPKFQILENEFSKIKASSSISELEPEMVLVIEIVGSVTDFNQAVNSIDGLEWLGEWEVEEIEATEDFYGLPEEEKIGPYYFINKATKVANVTKQKESKALREELLSIGFINQKGHIQEGRNPGNSFCSEQEILDFIFRNKEEKKENAKKKALTGKVFLSMSSERGLSELLSLWKTWQTRKELPLGKRKWRDVFQQLRNIRRWGIEESLRETGMLERWEDLLFPIPKYLNFQIEFFYRKKAHDRKKTERRIRHLIGTLGGSLISEFLIMPDILFHAVKAQLPGEAIANFLAEVNNKREINSVLFSEPAIMYFRPTGQSTEMHDKEGGIFVPIIDSPLPLGQPIVALLDGVPRQNHTVLKDRIEIDDIFGLANRVQAGGRKHGTAMASLIIRGDLNDDNAEFLSTPLYCCPVMNQSDLEISGHNDEFFPDATFYEDRIEQAVRHMFDGKAAPSIKIINLSLGDPSRPFIHHPSAWSRLLDMLSFKYRVLFCVSAGNYTGDIKLDIPFSEYVKLHENKKPTQLSKHFSTSLIGRRIISPAESINSLTIGALHFDHSSETHLGPRIDAFPTKNDFPSPLSRIGHGYRASIKPEIYFPGGRKLFRKPINSDFDTLEMDSSGQPPGQKVAMDSNQEGDLSRTYFTQGTSNSNALASRSAAKIYEMLMESEKTEGEKISDELVSVLIKSLLVHGARQNPDTKKIIGTKTGGENARKRQARFMGFGSIDLNRVLSCTDHRATLFAADEIEEDQTHEYRFPLPLSLSGKKVWRKMVITLAWFTPINPRHRNLREAKLVFNPLTKTLKMERTDYDYHQVRRGTIQHEVFEGKKEISNYLDGDEIVILVTCKKDATSKLDEKIPYGLAVTLEVEDGEIKIYEEIREKVRNKVQTKV